MSSLMFSWSIRCRCFALVEYTSLEQVATLDRMVSAVSSENHESIMGMGTAGTLHSVLIQCSPDIFQVSVKATQKVQLPTYTL